VDSDTLRIMRSALPVIRVDEIEAMASPILGSRCNSGPRL
jgi:hypothetical protein